jgi:hypothetical protein
MTPLENLAFAEAALMTDQTRAAWAAIAFIRAARAGLTGDASNVTLAAPASSEETRLLQDIARFLGPHLQP